MRIHGSLFKCHLATIPPHLGLKNDRKLRLEGFLKGCLGGFVVVAIKFEDIVFCVECFILGARRYVTYLHQTCR